MVEDTVIANDLDQELFSELKESLVRSLNGPCAAHHMIAIGSLTTVFRDRALVFLGLCLGM